MDIEYVVGSPDTFHNFVNSIGLYDKVAILTHVDLDGLSSALFLEKILGAKGIKVDYLRFLNIELNMIKKVMRDLKEKMISKIFICDINVESIDFEGFDELRNEKDVLLIDHHPIGEKLEDYKNIIKTVSSDCSALTIFKLGEEFIDKLEWGWLVCSTIFSDYSHKSLKNFEYLKSFYPAVRLDEIASSVPGLNARKISSALIYYKHDIKYVYDLVKNRQLEDISEIHELIEGEVNRLVEDFSKNNKYYPEKNLYFYEVKSPFDVLSYTTTLVSKMNSKGSFIFMYRKGRQIKFSARSTDEIQDMSVLMKKGVFGLEGASGGGHKAASAAIINLEDLEKFKERVFG